MANPQSTETTASGLNESVTTPRQPRIRFPVEATSPSQVGYASGTFPKQSRLASGPSIRHHSPLHPSKIGSLTNGRRRVRSVDAEDVPSGALLGPHRTPGASFVTPSRRPNAEARVREDNSGFSTFSDEYDLSHEDPRILQDVQRALKLKARREARMQAKTPVATPEMAKSNMSSTNSPLDQPIYPMISPSTSPRKGSLSSDVDFSPLTRVSTVHPVPASLDNGITLDWSGFTFNDKSERRWKLPTTKRRENEQLPHLSLIVDQQEKTHSDKITKIKLVASPQTLRKAIITSEQLGRRYKFIYGVLSVGSSPLNIAQVARWYGSQEPVVRSSLEKAQPFTWLKHLDKRGTRPPERSPRNLSALIIEEYIHAQLHHGPMKTLSEDLTLRNSAHDIPMSLSFVNTQLLSGPPRVSSHFSVGSSSAGRWLSEGQISFEPFVDLTQNSLEVESLRSGESSYNSMISGPSLDTRDFAPQISGKLMHDRDEILSSAEDYPSVQSDRKGYKYAETRLSDVELGPKSENKPDAPKEPSDIPEVELEAKQPAPAIGLVDDIREPAFPFSPEPYRHATFDRVSKRRRGLTSLPPSRRLSKMSESVRQQEADEERAHERKAKLLEGATTHNHRIRQLLNRISVSVREYETVLSNAMASLGVSHRGLPRDLLDAFGHDPAAVTGATRRYQGWRAVDDIHRRLIRQRDVFRMFISHHNLNMPVPESVVDDPIASLVCFLSELEAHSHVIAKQATEAAETLKSVQRIHANVKADYKSTLSHTSVVYPELSYIVALEESYKDQYQQFWEFGMDTLTFLLDTVTPFWRTYGKPIGEDIRDFLIIPLYRNEFTGEARKYPIRGVPSRSFRHWLGLALFFLASVAISFLQVRAAISSTAYYKLPMIPYEGIRWTALPFFWFGIVIQWWAVATESAIVMMQLGVLVWWAGWSIKIFT